MEVGAGMVSEEGGGCRWVSGCRVSRQTESECHRASVGRMECALAWCCAHRMLSHRVLQVAAMRVVPCARVCVHVYVRVCVCVLNLEGRKPLEKESARNGRPSPGASVWRSPWTRPAQLPTVHE